MIDFKYRTEDLRLDEFKPLYVETQEDRKIISSLKSSNPTIVVGSRGVGKSFLLRMAEVEMLEEFSTNGVLPVYVSFTKSSLVQSTGANSFYHWMLARICSRVVRSLKKKGLLTVTPQSVSLLAGGTKSVEAEEDIEIEKMVVQFENSWKNPTKDVDISQLPSIDDFKDAVEDLCESLNIKSISLLIDEAAHVFIPEQQRAFFTLFRDIRCPYMTCNAAVYPAVTYFGDTFQEEHDATILKLARDIMHEDYIEDMREIVSKQSDDSSFLRRIEQNGENFAILAYAASGNPRIFLKTLSKADRLTTTQVDTVIREYYRQDIWKEHSLLSEKYEAYKAFVDWGRDFMENTVLPDLFKKSKAYLEKEKNSTCFFWIHRDAPHYIKEALRLLSYSGIVDIHSKGMKATRREIGTRYIVNLGCLFALDSTPTKSAFAIAKSLTVKRMAEFGMNHPSYKQLLDISPDVSSAQMPSIVSKQLGKDIVVLDLSAWQTEGLRSIGINFLRDIIDSTESKLKQIKYVGDKRSRRMRNAAISAVYEYLSG